MEMSEQTREWAQKEGEMHSSSAVLPAPGFLTVLLILPTHPLA